MWERNIEKKNEEQRHIERIGALRYVYVLSSFFLQRAWNCQVLASALKLITKILDENDIYLIIQLVIYRVFPVKC